MGDFAGEEEDEEDEEELMAIIISNSASAANYKVQPERPGCRAGPRTRSQDRPPDPIARTFLDTIDDDDDDDDDDDEEVDSPMSTARAMEEEDDDDDKVLTPRGYKRKLLLAPHMDELRQRLKKQRISPLEPLASDFGALGIYEAGTSGCGPPPTSRYDLRPRVRNKPTLFLEKGTAPSRHLASLTSPQRRSKKPSRSPPPSTATPVFGQPSTPVVVDATLLKPHVHYDLRPRAPHARWIPNANPPPPQNGLLPHAASLDHHHHPQMPPPVPLSAATTHHQGHHHHAQATSSIGGHHHPSGS